MENKKVGIVILNFNCSKYLKYSLEALLKSKTNVDFEVGIVDNGSEKREALSAKKAFENFLESGGRGFFVQSEKNLGFSGGNNVAVKRFMEDPSITHICMLNSDVLVTDYWLEYLTEDGYDVTGSVTNATGNEQTIAIDYDVQLNQNAFEEVNQFSHYRHRTFAGAVAESDILYFFNTIFNRRVIEKIGLLDERFYPGSFEDADYCYRIKQAGFKQMIIRSCYVHHFGSGSFSKLDMPDRVNISNVNRKRFEEKWNTHWEGDSWKLLQSCREDINYFQDKIMDTRTRALLDKTIEGMETLIKNWQSGIEYYQSEQYTQNIIMQHIATQQLLEQENSDAPAHSMAPVVNLSTSFTYPSSLHGKQLLYLITKKVQLKLYQYIWKSKYEKEKSRVFRFRDQQYPTLPLGLMPGREMVKRCWKLLAQKLGLKRRSPDVSVLLQNDDLGSILKQSDSKDLRMISEIMDVLLNTYQKAAIHAPIFTKENERDGYIQRIKRVDEDIFDGFVRVYFYEDGLRKEEIHAEKIDEAHYFITYNSHDAEQRKLVFKLTEMCGLMYVHSVNRFMTDSVNAEMCTLFENQKIKTIWDVHGSVPEEYLMYGSEVGKQIADEVESFIYHRANVIVVVNHAMKRHLMRKHGESNAEFVVMPIFNVDLTKRYFSEEVKPEGEEKHITVVYAGGTQKWQNIELMQSIMENASEDYVFKIFVPDPKEFNTTWTFRKPKNVIVDSKAPEELGAEYEKCDYGFVLRDENVVNYVACPTKMIEYIQYGIVPIMKTSEIGDFVELGMQYVDYQDLLNGETLDEEARLSMAQHNFEILKALQEMYIEGVGALKTCVTRKKNKKNVGLIVTTFDKGGLEQVVLNLYFGYKENGYRTFLLCQKDMLGPMAERILPEDMFIFNDSEQELLGFIDREEIGIVHYHYSTFGMDKMHAHCVKSIYTMHNVYVWKDQKEICEYAQILQNADKVIAVSDFVNRYFRKRVGLDCPEIATIYNGIDFDELDGRELPAELSRASLGLRNRRCSLCVYCIVLPDQGTNWDDWGNGETAEN